MVRHMPSCSCRVVLRLLSPGSLILSTPWWGGGEGRGGELDIVESINKYSISGTILTTHPIFRSPTQQTHLRVASYIVCVQAHEVPQAVWQEHSTKSNLHHFFHVSLEDPRLYQLLQLSLLCQLVHVCPHDTWERGGEGRGECEAREGVR